MRNLVQRSETGPHRHRSTRLHSGAAQNQVHYITYVSNTEVQPHRFSPENKCVLLEIISPPWDHTLQDETMQPAEGAAEREQIDRNTVSALFISHSSEIYCNEL